FTDAEHDPQHEQREKAARKSHQQRARSPDQDSGCEQLVNREAVAQPTGEQLYRRVDPEEGGNGEAVILVRKLEIAFEDGSTRGKRSPVDIVEEDRDSEQ